MHRSYWKTEKLQSINNINYAFDKNQKQERKKQEKTPRK